MIACSDDKKGEEKVAEKTDDKKEDEPKEEKTTNGASAAGTYSIHTLCPLPISPTHVLSLT